MFLLNKHTAMKSYFIDFLRIAIFPSMAIYCWFIYLNYDAVKLWMKKCFLDNPTFLKKIITNREFKRQKNIVKKYYIHNIEINNNNILKYIKICKK